LVIASFSRLLQTSPSSVQYPFRDFLSFLLVKQKRDKELTAIPFNYSTEEDAPALSTATVSNHPQSFAIVLDSITDSKIIPVSRHCLEQQTPILLGNS
jgi:hypothetical protein